MKTRVFQTDGPARYSFLTRFGPDNFANVTFFDDRKEDIPFHLSLRRDEKVASLNNRTPLGWGPELHWPLQMDSDEVSVDISIDSGRVRVALNRAHLNLSPEIVTRFSDVDRIVFAETHGAVVPASVDMDTRLPGQSLDQPLAVTRRLQIRASLPCEPWTPRLHATGIREPMPLAPSPDREGRQDASLILPGRLWAGGQDRIDFHLVAPDRRSLHHLRLSRRDLLARVRDILSTGDLRGDPVLAATVAEHVRYARLLPHLPPEMVLTLVRALQSAKLPDYLDTSASRLPRPEPLVTPAARERLDKAIAQLSAAFEKEAAASDIRETLSGITLSVAETRTLALSMMEPFCVHGDVQLLIEWADSILPGDFVPEQDPWYNSTILPFLFCHGKLDDVADLIDTLSEDADTHLATPAIAWVAQAALEACVVENRKCEAILDSFARFLTAQAASYWARTPCEMLVSASARIAVGCEWLPPALANDLTDAIVAVYGLSRQFWSKFPGNPKDLSRKMQAARHAMAVVENAWENPGAQTPAVQTEQALSWLEEQGCIEAKRIRRDLFGPAGVAISADKQLPPPSELDLRIPDAAEASIRAAAFPGAGALSDDHTAFCAEWLTRFDASVPTTADAAMLRRATNDVMQTLRDEPADIPARLKSDLGALARIESGFAGIALALGLVAELRGTPRLEPALTLLQSLLLALPETERRSMAGSPACTAAIRTLATHPGLSHRLRGLLPDIDHLPKLPQSPFPACALHNTLILVFSCRAHLDSRIPQLRNGWLRDAIRHGIPYLIVVGNGVNRIEGDVLGVDAPDTYEGLPDKMLSALSWVQNCTAYTHMLKVDDDCYLDVAAYFDSYTYRLADYYGRPLTRTEGQTDRAWHMARSVTERGQTELDKSPEPSIYADGGCGYALSRTAIAAALKTAESQRGKALRRVSFMEDKLLGDLLSLAGIPLCNDNYLVSVRRRSHPAGMPVARWANGFWPSRAAPVKLVHMDTHRGQFTLGQGRRKLTLSPSKIWPSFQDVRLGYQSNALELISPASRIDAAREASVAVVSCVRNEMFMLPHFLQHYRALGVGSFLIADNGSDDGTLEYLTEQADVILFSVDTDYRDAAFGVAWQQALMSAFRAGKWTLAADADELLVWRLDGRGSLPDLLDDDAFQGADAARIFMLDMYPRGPISGADFRETGPFTASGFVDRTPFRTNWPGRGPFSNARTWTSALRHRLIPGSRPDLFVAQKLALLRYHPWMRLSEGLHYGAGMTLAGRDLIFGHFKYNADFHRKVRAEIARSQHFNNAEEYRSYAALFGEGRDIIHAAGVSVHWADCDFVRKRLDPDIGSALTNSPQSPGMDVMEEGPCHSTRPSSRSLTAM